MIGQPALGGSGASPGPPSLVCVWYSDMQWGPLKGPFALSVGVFLSQTDLKGGHSFCRLLKIRMAETRMYSILKLGLHHALT